MDEFIRVVLLFFIYSFVGWLWETVYCSIKAGHFVYRGFLVGPITPIYGFGILGVLYFIEPFQNNLVALYFLSAILVTVLEYLTSYVLEKMFHATWWDYKDVPLNIDGRVAVPVSLFWGVGCVLIVRVIHPRILLMENWLAQTFGIVLPLILLAVMAVDLVYTVTNMQGFKKLSQQLETAVEERKQLLEDELTVQRQELSQTIEEKKVQTQQLFMETTERSRQRMTERLAWLESLIANSEWKDALPKINGNQRRLVRSFPKLKLKDAKNKEEMQAMLDELRRKNK